jgi:hypothetical protein
LGSLRSLIHMQTPSRGRRHSSLGPSSRQQQLQLILRCLDQIPCLPPREFPGSHHWLPPQAQQRRCHQCPLPRGIWCAIRHLCLLPLPPWYQELWL